MMSELLWFHLLLFAGITILVQCLENPLLVTNDEERDICEQNAGSNRKVTEATKDKRLSCKIICKYDDGSKELCFSPDGQPCCDIVGGLPTGCCKNGTCPVGKQNCVK